MIYTVECSFADPALEAEWDDFYSRIKLPALISVPGFRSSQRFKALTSGCPVYLAVHTVEGPEVLVSDAYRQKGGGNFARWQHLITDWHRNLYAGIDLAPGVGDGEHLLLNRTGPESLQQSGLTPLALRAVGLDREPEHRWMARLDSDGGQVADRLPSDIARYRPLGQQLLSAQ